MRENWPSAKKPRRCCRSRRRPRSRRVRLGRATPKPPTARLIETFGLAGKEYASRAGMDWIGDDIPRNDARWIASLLTQLSHQQLVEAFRAGHFPPDEIDAYVEVVESRIHELSTL